MIKFVVCVDVYALNCMDVFYFYTMCRFRINIYIYIYRKLKVKGLKQWWIDHGVASSLIIYNSIRIKKHGMGQSLCMTLTI